MTRCWACSPSSRRNSTSREISSAKARGPRWLFRSRTDRGVGHRGFAPDVLVEEREHLFIHFRAAFFVEDAVAFVTFADPFWRLPSLRESLTHAQGVFERRAFVVAAVNEQHRGLDLVRVVDG